MQCIESGLVMVNADPYLYPMVMAAVIFAAVLLDSRRSASRSSARSVVAGPPA